MPDHFQAPAPAARRESVLDVRGIDGRPARIREIRAMAGRAMLDGPHDYKVADLEGPLLDLAVSKAEGLNAVIHKVDNAIEPFFECCVLNECGRLQYQYMPSRDWTQGGPIIEREDIDLEHYRPHAELKHCVARMRHPHRGDGPTALIAAMRAYVGGRFGGMVRM